MNELLDLFTEIVSESIEKALENEDKDRANKLSTMHNLFLKAINVASIVYTFQIATKQILTFNLDSIPFDK